MAWDALSDDILLPEWFVRIGDGHLDGDEDGVELGSARDWAWVSPIIRGQLRF
jgi:hypothetical protein